MSRGREFDPGLVPYFCGDWSWNYFYGHSPPFRWIIQEGLLSVTSESMCTKYWLTWDVKQQNKQTNISSCFRHSSCRINSTADKRGTFILELIPPSMDAFYNCRERWEKISRIITNRRGFLLIRTQFMLHSAYSQLIRDRFINLLEMSGISGISIQIRIGKR